MEQEVIADISRRVKKMERFTETAELMAKHMVEQGYSAVKIRAEVMKYLRADKNYQEAIAKNTKEYKEGTPPTVTELSMTLTPIPTEFPSIEELTSSAYSSSV